RVDNGNALGGSSGDVFIVNGAVLDLGSAAQGNVNFGQKLFHIAGNGGGRGVLTNRSSADPSVGGATQASAFQRVIFDADASIGGPGSGPDTPTNFPAGRIDIRAAT